MEAFMKKTFISLLSLLCVLGATPVMAEEGGLGDGSTSNGGVGGGPGGGPDSGANGSIGATSGGR